ncbi:MAG: hypothetical protein ACRD2W_16085 [Acidimicrobiales bacterium]
MAEVSFTAGITFSDDRVETVDVVAIDGSGMKYTTEEGEAVVTWDDVKAVMLATTDHMLESAGSLFSMAERMEDAGDPGAAAAPQMRQIGFGVLRQAAPRLCPFGPSCGLRPGYPAQG